MAGVRRVAVVEQILPPERGDDRNGVARSKAAERGARVVTPARAADDEHWTASCGQPRANRLEIVRGNE
jgi:hypothetical protein